MASYHITNTQLAEEQKWIAAAQKDPRHFGKIYEFYYKRIYLFIYKRVENEDVCADVTSQVFLKAMTNLNKFSFQGVPFSAWLYRIALNEVNMHYRNNKSQATESVESHQLAEMVEEGDDLFSEDNVQKLLQLLKHLPPDDMKLISLRFFEQMSFKEVAEICEMTENNAKVRVYRILERLKKQFGPTKG
ncbi:MAG: RNA polymerase sigma factor [Bacteroidia bacterium]